MEHMRVYAALLVGCAAVMVAAMPAPAGAVEREMFKALGTSEEAQTDRLIVKYRDARASGLVAGQASSITSRRKAIIDRAGQQFGNVLKPLHALATGAHVLKLARKMAVRDVEALAAELAQRDPDVEYAEPDLIGVAAFTPNDSYYQEQWNYFEAAAGLRLPEAWDKSTGAGINVAVVDTGYRPHADLSGQILPGYDFVSDPARSGDGDGRDADAIDPGDWTLAGECGQGSSAANSSWHGTHVSGTIAALTKNGIGVAGVAFGAKIVPARVLGKCGGFASDMADAIIWASGGTVSGVPANTNKARVINMSISAFNASACPATLQSAIDSARLRGTVLVVSAGNKRLNAGSYWPANCQGVIAVAALARSGGKASYSNYGSVVDVAAPGGDVGEGILSTLNAGISTPASDSYAYYMGTSMAAPHVAGTVALMLARNPGLTPDEVKSRLKATARAFPVTCTLCGAGIVDANAAVIAAATPAPTQSESEPNNTIATANAVTSNGTLVSGTMGSSTDDDYFAVPVPAGKRLTATLTMGMATADYDLYVYDSAGRQLGWSQNTPGAARSVLTMNVIKATPVLYVRVKYRAGGTGATNGQYTLKLTW